MGTKFTLSTESKQVSGKTVYRIVATQDIDRHNVKEGDLGGFVESADVLDQGGDCWITDDASVLYGSRISANAIVGGDAVVINSKVSGNALIGDSATVTDSSVSEASYVLGESIVRGSSISGSSFVEGRAVVENSEIIGSSVARGNVSVAMATIRDSEIFDRARVSYSVVESSSITGTTRISDQSDIAFSTITAGSYSSCHIGGEVEEEERIHLDSQIIIDGALIKSNNDLLVFPNILGTAETLAVYRRLDENPDARVYLSGIISTNLGDSSFVGEYIDDVSCLINATGARDVTSEAELLVAFVEQRVQEWNS